MTFSAQVKDISNGYSYHKGVAASTDIKSIRDIIDNVDQLADNGCPAIVNMVLPGSVFLNSFCLLLI